MKVLITGAAGFIGFHTAKRYLDEGHEVLGYDGFTEYYDPKLKRRRIAVLDRYAAFTLVEGRLENIDLLTSVVEGYQPELVIHLAAQAGVRYSIDNPGVYISANIQGTYNLLEALREYQPQHLLFASTSSVYGANPELPFKETDRTAFPVSLYAATKSAGEQITHSYSNLFGVPTTCFRFFTVYGPWGRPDMALFKFVDRILRGEPIDVYGNGQMSRDFTFVDDLVESIVRLGNTVPAVGKHRSELENESASPVAPWRIVNIAGGEQVSLTDFIAAIEDAVGIQAKKNMLPMQQGDVTDTVASSELLVGLTRFKPNTQLRHGVKAFVDWFVEYKRGTDNGLELN